jgi:hypothetical protein
LDATRFDALTRALAAPRSRRHLLGGLAAGALGLAGFRSADARTCSAGGTICREHANCCSSNCLPKDRTGRRRCAECGSPAQCPSDTCTTPTCSGGACGTTPANESGACTDSGGAAGTCQSGTCVATPPCEPPGGPCTISNFDKVCCPNADGVRGCRFPTGDPNNGLCFLS